MCIYGMWLYNTVSYLQETSSETTFQELVGVFCHSSFELLAIFDRRVCWHFPFLRNPENHCQETSYKIFCFAEDDWPTQAQSATNSVRAQGVWHEDRIAISSECSDRDIYPRSFDLSVRHNCSYTIVALQTFQHDFVSHSFIIYL